MSVIRVGFITHCSTRENYPLNHYSVIFQRRKVQLVYEVTA